jgi:uncharacterized protein
MDKKRVILAGGSGFIGQCLTQELLARNYEVVVLTRSPRARNDGVAEAQWDGEHGGEWSRFLTGAEAIVNLTGKNINCPHTSENLRELTASRVDSVRGIAAGLSQVETSPRVWVQAGAIGFYGDQKEKVCDENSPAGNDALAEVCRQWENTFHSAKTPEIRKVVLRIGFVLGRDGGALPVLARLTKWFLGGAAGSGRQFISWIHLSDLAQVFVQAIENENFSGIFNAVAPDPVMNKDFMRELRRTLHRPWSPPAPAWAVKLGSCLMNSEPSLALAGCRVAPKRLLENGFKFQFSQLPAALKNIYQ